jgi:anti-sigma factor (TIGR02949 family)
MTHQHTHSHEKSCQELLASIGEYVEGDASQQLCREIERHLADCQNCRVVVDTLNKTIYLYKTTAQDVETPADVRGRLFEALHLDDYLKKDA